MRPGWEMSRCGKAVIRISVHKYLYRITRTRNGRWKAVRTIWIHHKTWQGGISLQARLGTHASLEDAMRHCEAHEAELAGRRAVAA